MNTLITRLLIAVGLCTTAACSRSIDVANHDGGGLVEAIRAANADPGPQTIRLARRGLYVLDRAAEPGLMLPRIRDDLVIEGDGAEIRAYTGERLALVEVGPGATLSLERLSLAEGSDGAVRNYGQLALDQVRITDNTGDRSSAIVLNHGDLVARDSEIAYNALEPVRRDAGILLNYGQAELERCTIHDNRAAGRNPSLAVAAGVLNFGSLRVDGLALADNAADSAGGRFQFGGILNIGNGKVRGEVGQGMVRRADLLATLSP